LGRKLFNGKGEHGTDDGAEIVLAELKLDRPAKIDEHLHNAIETMNFGFDDFEMAGGRSAGAGGCELALEELNVNNDGVDGVLDFVAHSGGEAADGGHAAGELELGLDGLDGFEIVEGEERAQSLTRLTVMNELEGEFDALAGFSDDDFLGQRSASREGLAKGPAWRPRIGR